MEKAGGKSQIRLFTWKMDQVLNKDEININKQRKTKPKARETPK